MSDVNISIIGLGYVGKPLLLSLSRNYHVKGYDKDVQVSNNIKNFLNEQSKVIKSNAEIIFDESHLHDSNIYIVTVPTPVDEDNKPDFSPLISACEMLGKYLLKGDIVVFESTVSPGTTEEVCLPAILKTCGLKYNKDFFLGYSPERVSPGDEDFSLSSMKKLVSASSPETLVKLLEIYDSVTDAGTVPVDSIKVAETSKMIENVQRDVNIALMNELSNICRKLGISTSEVIDAASTKSNFIKFTPGLVGGHCVAVDPYYWIDKSEQIGHKAELAFLARKVNDQQSLKISEEILSHTNNTSKNEFLKGIIFGFTFKENCDDIRNTLVYDLFKNLQDNGVSIDIFDPVANSTLVKKNYEISLLENLDIKDYNFLVLAVGHDIFKEYLPYIKELKSNGTVIFDLKNFLDEEVRDWVI